MYTQNNTINFGASTLDYMKRFLSIDKFCIFFSPFKTNGTEIKFNDKVCFHQEIFFINYSVQNRR